MSKLKVSGCLPAIVTPFSADASHIDYSSLERVVDHVLLNNCSGVVVCGSTGEAQTLSDEEYRQVVTFVRDRVSGRGLCIAGVPAIATAKVAQTVVWLEQQKIDAAMIVAPAYVKPTQAGIVAHFSQISASSKLPLVAYNVPSRTGVNILPTTIAALAESSTICALKEASSSLDQIVELVSLGITKKIALISGEDSLTQTTVAAGGEGVISVVANLLPKQISHLVELACKGQVSESAKLQADLYPIIRACFMESNPIPIKSALKIAGLIEHDCLRLPLTTAVSSTRARLEELVSLWQKI